MRYHSNEEAVDSIYNDFTLAVKEVVQKIIDYQDYPLIKHELK
jgi:hypothetical protein